jgi:glutathione S-transferase
MSDLVLYHASPSRSSVVLWMLEELGEPYDVKLIKLADNDQHKPDYLKLNPLGKVPTLVHKGVPITEVSAICTYLADEFPARGLNIPPGNPQRGVYLKWLFFAPSVVEPAANDKVFPRKEPARPTAIGYRDLDTVLDVVARAVSPGPFLMGERFTAADVALGSLVRYGMMFGFIPKRDEFEAYAGRLAARPAAQKAAAKDEQFAKA